MDRFDVTRATVEQGWVQLTNRGDRDTA
jgi:hypothetical protein